MVSIQKTVLLKCGVFTSVLALLNLLVIGFVVFSYSGPFLYAKS